MQKLSYLEANDLICGIEKEKRLLERHQMFGWSIWPSLRFAVGSNLAGIRKVFPAKTKLMMARNFFFHIKEAICLLLRQRSISGKSVALTTSREWRISTDRGISSIYFGTLIDSHEGLVYVEKINQDTSTLRRNLRSARAQGSINSFEQLVAVIIRVSFFLGCFREKAIALHTDLAALRGQGDNDPAPLAMIQRAFCGFAAGYFVYKILWRFLGAESLVLTASYGKEPMIAAAKSEGMQVIEQQHGTIYNGHFGYSYEPEVLETPLKLPFPDIFCAYGRYWVDCMGGLGFWHNSSLRICGSVEIDRCRARKRPTTDKGIRQFIVTTQNIFDCETIAFLARSFESIEDSWNCVIRTHPLLDSSAMERWVKTSQGRWPNINLIFSSGQDNRKSTNDIIMDSLCHVSVASTCLQEALGLGIPSIVLPLSGSENVTNLKGVSGAFFPETPYEFSKLLEVIGNNKIEVESEYFFESGAIQNLRDLLHPGNTSAG